MLETSDEDIIMLWRNSPSVIIGKNQNTYAEVNDSFVRENKIAVVRRLTGGGAVFHDLGNVNFSFICPLKSEQGAEINFKPYIAPVISVLSKLGAETEMDGRNDIVSVIDGRKISGNAQCIYHRKSGGKSLLHHGTLLFGADLSRLSGALNVKKEKFESKGIESVRSRVVNISDLIEFKMTAEEFLLFLCRELGKIYDNGFSDKIYDKVSSFDEREISEIEKLSQEKYSLWEWNYGKSKKYSFESEKRFAFGSICVKLDTDAGIINDIKIYGDFFGGRDISELEKLLCGKRYLKEEISSVLELNSDIAGECISGCTSDEIISVIFD